jgi:hypothetical protein
MFQLRQMVYEVVHRTRALLVMYVLAVEHEMKDSPRIPWQQIRDDPTRGTIG